jgi:hypothetical protein
LRGVRSRFRCHVDALLAALDVAVSDGGIEVKGCIFNVLIQFQIVRTVVNSLRGSASV